MKKKEITKFLRKIRLLHLFDWLRYYFHKISNLKKNAAFKKRCPFVVLPPDYLIYESFQLDYKKYYDDSFETAKWLANHFSSYINLKNAKILDWGCGPGRIIRHLPKIIKSADFYGTDYNNRSIKWCSENLPNISFNHNSLKADLPYENGSFDVIYGISIFTHLSEQMHYNWYKELYRILRPGGILFITTQGDNFKRKLNQEEKNKFDEGALVVRGNVREGHRVYSSFQPVNFMKKLFFNVKILKHIETDAGKNRVIPQDIWIVKK